MALTHINIRVFVNNKFHGEYGYVKNFSLGNLITNICNELGFNNKDQLLEVGLYKNRDNEQQFNHYIDDVINQLVMTIEALKRRSEQYESVSGYILHLNKIINPELCICKFIYMDANYQPAPFTIYKKIQNSGVETASLLLSYVSKKIKEIINPDGSKATYRIIENRVLIENVHAGITTIYFL